MRKGNPVGPRRAFATFLSASFRAGHLSNRGSRPLTRMSLLCLQAKRTREEGRCWSFRHNLEIDFEKSRNPRMRARKLLRECAGAKRPQRVVGRQEFFHSWDTSIPWPGLRKIFAGGGQVTTSTTPTAYGFGVWLHVPAIPYMQCERSTAALDQLSEPMRRTNFLFSNGRRHESKSHADRPIDGPVSAPMINAEIPPRGQTKPARATPPPPARGNSPHKHARLPTTEYRSVTRCRSIVYIGENDASGVCSQRCRRRFSSPSPKRADKGPYSVGANAPPRVVTTLIQHQALGFR